jgi:hypothetical protein
VDLDDTLVVYTAQFAHEPIGIALDPAFDVFRRLDRAEIPASFGQAFGAERALIVLPSDGPRSTREAWSAFARAISDATSGKVEVVEDKAVDPAALAGQAVWFLGAGNRLRPPLAPELAAQVGQAAATGSAASSTSAAHANPADSTAVIVMPSARDPEQAWVLVSASDPVQLAPLARKLPHYRKYGYLAFRGPEATNVAKAEWRVTVSPLARLLGGARFDPPGTAPNPMAVPPAEPLAKLAAHPAPK